MTANAALNGHHYSRQIIGEIFIDIMKTSMLADRLPCPTAVNSALFILVRGPAKDVSLSDIQVLKREHPDVLAECERFLMYHRTPEQRHSLSHSESSRCLCTLNTPVVRDLHRTDIFRPRTLAPVDKEPLLSVLRALMRVMMLVSESLPGTGMWKTVRLTRRSLRYGRPVAWPRNLDDIAPDGSIPAVIHNICGWADCCPDIHLLTLAHATYVRIATHAFPSALFLSIVQRAFMPITGKSHLRS